MALFCGTYIAYGQQTNSFAVQSLLQSDNTSFTNSALWKDRKELQLGNLSRTGPFKNIRSFYLGSFNDLDGKHGLGLSIVRFERGELISETTVNGAYRYKLPINEDLKLSLGAHVGFHQLNLESTNNTDGGSDLKLDIDLSTALFGKNWRIGASVLNVTSPELVLINQSIEFGLTFGVFGEYTFDLTPDWKIISNYQSSHSQTEQFFTLGGKACYKDMYIAGLVVTNQTTGFVLGMQRLNVSKYKLDFQAGYQRPVLVNSSSSFNQFQLQLSLYK